MLISFTVRNTKKATVAVLCISEYHTNKIEIKTHRSLVMS